MPADVTLPGSIPGLLRRGSPVTCEAGIFGHTSGVVTGYPPRTTGWIDVAWDGGVVSAMPPQQLALDLTDATGRAHAAWWMLARQWDAMVELAEGSVRRWRPEAHSTEIKVRYDSDNRVAVWFEGVVYCERRPFMTAGSWRYVVMPTAGGLNPNDPRTLPDGSRLVDALALQRVCLHVAGLEVTDAR